MLLLQHSGRMRPQPPKHPACGQHLPQRAENRHAAAVLLLLHQQGLQRQWPTAAAAGFTTPASPQQHSGKWPRVNMCPCAELSPPTAAHHVHQPCPHIHTSRQGWQPVQLLKVPASPQARVSDSIRQLLNMPPPPLTVSSPRWCRRTSLRTLDRCTLPARARRHCGRRTCACSGRC